MNNGQSGEALTVFEVGRIYNRRQEIHEPYG